MGNKNVRKSRRRAARWNGLAREEEGGAFLVKEGGLLPPAAEIATYRTCLLGRLYVDLFFWRLRGGMRGKRATA
jgi:hypothetical protein